MGKGKETSDNVQIFAYDIVMGRLLFVFLDLSFFFFFLRIEKKKKTMCQADISEERKSSVPEGNRKSLKHAVL